MMNILRIEVYIDFITFCHTFHYTFSWPISVSNFTCELHSGRTKKLQHMEKNIIYDMFTTPIILRLFKQNNFISFGQQFYIISLLCSHRILIVLLLFLLLWTTYMTSMNHSWDNFDISPWIMNISWNGFIFR